MQTDWFERRPCLIYSYYLQRISDNVILFSTGLYEAAVRELWSGGAVGVSDVLVALGHRVGDEMGELELPLRRSRGVTPAHHTHVATV